MHFRTMFLISKEKYEALNRRLTSRDTPEHLSSKFSPSDSKDNTSTAKTQTVTSQDVSTIKKIKPITISRTAEKNSCTSNDEFEKHVKVINCPVLKHKDIENNTQNKPNVQVSPVTRRKRKFDNDQNQDFLIDSKRVKTDPLMGLNDNNEKTTCGR